MSSKFLMEPRVTFLSEFLKEIKDGKIQIPRFQRELVWDWPQRRDLLCSIFEGLPIGALLVWNTRLSNIKSYQKIGPFPVKTPINVSGQTYLMDGLQRMSTLYGTTYLWNLDEEVKSTSQIKEFSVYCDLKWDSVEDLFLLEREINSKDLQDMPYRFMPLNLVFNTKEFVRFQRSIPLEHDSLLDRSEEVSTAFRNYKIPVVPLETDDQALVTKSFERINSRGTIMSEAHMLNALSFSSDFDFLSFIDREREEQLGTLPVWKEQLDVKFILMLLKMKLGFGPYYKDTDKLAKALSKSPDHLTKIFGAIERMANFSENYLYIQNPNDFPYRLQMLGLANALLDDTASNDQTLLDKLVSWFWISTYTNSFGSTARNSQRSLEDLNNFIGTGILSWTLNNPPICQSLTGWDVNYKSARIKTWGYALASKLDENCSNRSHRNLLNAHRGNSLIQIGEFRNLPKRPGNCFLIDPKTSPKVTIYEWSEEMRGLHFIDEVGFKLYKNKDFTEFSNHREHIIFEWEKSNFVIPAAKIAGLENIIQFSE